MTSALGSIGHPSLICWSKSSHIFSNAPRLASALLAASVYSFHAACAWDFLASICSFQPFASCGDIGFANSHSGRCESLRSGALAGWPKRRPQLTARVPPARVVKPSSCEGDQQTSMGALLPYVTQQFPDSGNGLLTEKRLYLESLRRRKRWSLACGEATFSTGCARSSGQTKGKQTAMRQNFSISGNTLFDIVASLIRKTG